LEGIREDSGRKPESSYGWMKLASERLVTTLFSSGSVSKGLIARFPNITGRRQTHGVVKDLVQKYFNLDEPWFILGDGFQEKPYLHASELVEILTAVESDLSAGSLLELNISPESSTTVRSIVEEIEAVARLGRNPIYGESPYGWIGDIPRYKFDTSKLIALGFTPSHSLQAIRRSVAEEVIQYIE
jgi:UDP-glucose 4-epimerase